jgi:diacylglycerol kinase family enzyme
VAWYVLALCLRRHLRQRDVAWGRARRVQVHCANNLPLQTDGEASGFGPVELAVEPGALRVIEP